MYKILIRYNDKHNLWQSYGTTISSTTTSTSFTEFETDDVEILKNEILKLNAIYGHDNIRIIEDITIKYSVDVILSAMNNTSEINNTIDNKEQNSGE